MKIDETFTRRVNKLEDEENIKALRTLEKSKELSRAQWEYVKSAIETIISN